MYLTVNFNLYLALEVRKKPSQIVIRICHINYGEIILNIGIILCGYCATYTIDSGEYYNRGTNQVHFISGLSYLFLYYLLLLFGYIYI